MSVLIDMTSEEWLALRAVAETEEPPLSAATLADLESAAPSGSGIQSVLITSSAPGADELATLAERAAHAYRDDVQRSRLLDSVNRQIRFALQRDGLL